MPLLSNASIKQRLTNIIMSVSGICVLLTTLSISVFGAYSLRGDLAKEIDGSASIVGDRNVAALLFNDDQQAKSNLSVFSVNHTIVQACLYKAGGALFARYVGAAYEKTAHCPADLSERLSIGDGRIARMKPIFDKTKAKVGSIYLESTQERVDQYIRDQIGIAGAVALGALAVSYLLAIRLRNAIARPILSLADTARQVSQHKDYRIRATPLGDPKNDVSNELVILTQSFNEMLSEIDARAQQLQRQNVELEKARDAAESASRAKSQFLANISHELRTPLNAIIGFSSILMNQLFGPLGDHKYLEYARDINESGSHLLDIINDILDLSKAEAGKLTLTYEELHVAKAIGKAITIMAERAAKSKVTLFTDIPNMLPPLVADRLRFLQILLNIISNAVKFTEEGGKILISVRIKEEGSRVTQFILTVRDTGIGMAKDDIAKAFQSFGQVDSGLNRKFEGTGLGLPLTRKLMELHHGTIGIESEPGIGTLVTLTFPAQPPEEELASGG